MKLMHEDREVQTQRFYTLAELFLLFQQTSDINDIKINLFKQSINRIARNEFYPYFKMRETHTAIERTTQYIFLNKSEKNTDINSLRLSNAC